MSWQKIKRGGHFDVLAGMWIFQPVHRTTNSRKPQVNIRLAFDFFEHSKRAYKKQTIKIVLRRVFFCCLSQILHLAGFQGFHLKKLKIQYDF